MKGFNFKLLSFLFALSIAILSASIYAAASPVVSAKVFEVAKKNTSWKHAFATSDHTQVVFMNVSPQTNPKNEIGMETHPFDQIIFIVAGKGKAIVNGKDEKVMDGDMIFIPRGTPHNVVNLDKNEPIKILSIYSENDIPANADYKTKADQKD